MRTPRQTFHTRRAFHALEMRVIESFGRLQWRAMLAHGVQCPQIDQLREERDAQIRLIRARRDAFAPI